MKQEDAPIDSSDSKSNIAQKLLALGEEIIKFHADPERYKKQIAVYNVELLAPPGNCEQNCSYCSAEFMKTEHSKIVNALGCKQESNIDLPLVKKVLDQLVDVGTKAVAFTGGGDWSPFPWLPEAIAYAKSVGFSTGLISHFASTHFSETELEMIVKNSDWIRGSLDSYDKESYEKVRHPNAGNHFENMEHNISAIAGIRKKTNRQNQEFGAQMVICRENYGDIEKIVRYAETLGVQYIQIRPIELRGRLISVDGVTKDSGQHKYADKYDGFSQLEEAGRLCDRLAEDSKIKVIFRWDKVNTIKLGGDFTEEPKKTFKYCVGSHFSGSLQITRPVVISQCYWRYDQSIAVDMDKGTFTFKGKDGKITTENGTLKDAFFSEKRQQFYGIADASRHVCSSLCKYAVINQVWEERFSKMPNEEFAKLVHDFDDKIARGEVNVSYPYHL